jgi:hypothetical protein
MTLMEETYICKFTDSELDLIECALFEYLGTQDHESGNTAERIEKLREKIAEIE